MLQLIRELLAVAAVSGLALAVLTASGCVSLPEDQAAYDVCTPNHNNIFLRKPGHKAIVSGVSGSSSRCYWNWSQPSTETAIARAMADCHKTYNKCYLYASDQGWSDWVRRISDNGGATDATRNVQANNAAAANAILGGLAAGLAAGAAGNGGYTPPRQRRSTGGSSGNNCPGATIAVDPVTCEVLH